MKKDHTQIHEIVDRLKGLITHWREQPEDKEELLELLQEYAQKVFTHLDEEETTIKPAASVHLTQEEWDLMSEMGREDTKDSPRALVLLGYLLNCSSMKEARKEFWKKLPPPAKIMYKLLGKKKFEKEWEQLQV